MGSIVVVLVFLHNLLLQWSSALAGGNLISVAGESSPFTKLPGDLKPVKYTLWIRPVLELSKDFTPTTAPGVVRIQFQVVKETKEIVVHAKDLRIDEADVKIKDIENGKDISIGSHKVDHGTQTYTVNTKDVLKQGKKYEISIRFLANMFNKQTGLYGFAWPGFWEPGPPLRLASTSRFQPYYAREAFPCFDEPHYRTTFEIVIGRLEHFRSFSNARIKETTPCKVKGWFWDHYEPTPPIPTSDVSVTTFYNYTESAVKAKSGTEIKVWLPTTFNSREGGGNFAAMLTANLMDYMQNYLDIPFPLDKLESIATWHTYAPAIGRLGSITYNLAAGSILNFPGSTPQWKLLTVVSLIAQQVARQWFGGVISIKDWTEAWLLEGIGEYLAHTALALHHPEFKPHEAFITSNNHVAFRIDQSKARPTAGGRMNNEGLNMDRIGHLDENFNPKAAVIVRMLVGAINEEAFQAGLRSVMKKYSNGSANANEILQEISASTKDLPVPLEDIVKSWSQQPGCPVLRATMANEKTVKITQEPFKSPVSSAEDKTIWWIPLKICNSDKAAERVKVVWMNHKEQTVSIAPSKWVFLNCEANGFYRVVYDTNMLMSIKNQLLENHKEFSASSRSQLLDDYFTFAQHGYVPWEATLELMAYLHKETDLVVWNVIFAHLQHAIYLSRGNNDFQGIKKYLVPKMEAIIKDSEVDFKEERKGAVALLQSEIFRYACAMESSLCIEYSTAQFEKRRSNPQSNLIPLDLRPVVYCTAVSTGDKSLWDFAKKTHDEFKKSEEKMYLFNALACSKDQAALQTLLEDSWKPSGPHLALETLEAMASNPIAKPILLQHLMAHTDRISPADFVRILNRLAEQWVAPQLVSEIEKFVVSKRNYFVSVQSDVRDEVDSMKANLIWARSTGMQMDKWFNTS